MNLRIQSKLHRRVHGRLIDSRGFKAHHWSVFIECTLFHFREVLGSAPSFSSEATMDRAIIVWRSVLRIIIKRMKVGLASDLLNRQANRIAEEPSTSERSSPVANITSTIPHALTLPIINGNNKGGGQDSPKARLALAFSVKMVD
nr:Protein GLB-19, isoform b [Haemonchus contortus]